MERRISNFTFSQNKCLGRGSFSQVFQGYHDHTKETVAVKIIDKKLLQAKANADLITGEIETMKRLSHPGLVEMFEVCQSDNNIYLILEFCNQGDLQKLLQNGPLEESQALYIFRQIVEAYGYLFERGVMHRDLKPANIFIHDNKVKIADFGFAIQSNRNNQIKTDLAGTPAYSSPQMLSKSGYSYKNDIWSMGVLLYEMTQGQTPWASAQNKMQLLRMMATTKIKFDRPISQNLQHLILKLLEYNESKRLNFETLQAYFQTPQETRDYLIDYIYDIFKDVQTNDSLIILQYILLKSIINMQKKMVQPQPDANLEKQFNHVVSMIQNQNPLKQYLICNQESIHEFGPAFKQFIKFVILQTSRKLIQKIQSKPSAKHEICQFISRLITFNDKIEEEQKCEQEVHTISLDFFQIKRRIFDFQS